MIIVAALAVNVVLHATIIFRFGVKGNEPPLAFGVVYVALAAALALSLPYSLIATLVVAVIGTAGLAVSYKSIPHEKTVEKVILALNAAIILYTAYLLFKG